jgi:hypothetical protein
MIPALLHSQFVICAAEADIATLSNIFAHFITALLSLSYIEIQDPV